MNGDTKPQDTAQPSPALQAMQLASEYLKQLTPTSNHPPQPTPTQGVTTLSPQTQPQRQRTSGFSGSGLLGIAGSIIKQVNERKQRKLNQFFANFTENYHGLEDAKAKGQEAQQRLQAAAQKLQQNPQDDAAKQEYSTAAQEVQQAQEALKQNQQNLKDLFNGPDGEKNKKLIEKGLGIDDKNKDSPERQAAIAAIQKRLGVDANTASVASRIPQTMQLSTGAREQQAAIASGAVGKPASGGQVLAAQGRAQAEAGKTERAAVAEQGKTFRASQRDELHAAMAGMKYEDGKLVPMTKEEIAKNPLVAAKLSATQASNDLKQAQTELTNMKGRALPEELKMQEAKVATLQGNLQMRMKEFTIKQSEEERKRLETEYKIGGGTSPSYVIGEPSGLIEEGNIDLNHRPLIQNADGSHSTEFSISFGTDKGEVLVPTVVNGKFLTPDGKKPPSGSAEEKAMFKRAREHYEQTGEHMGIFKSAKEADAYAQQVHNRQDSKHDISALTGGKPMLPWAQRGIAETLPVLEQLQELRDRLEPLKDNNQNGYLAMDRLAYAFGKDGETGSLASEISNIELQRVVGAARILKGSSRALSALELAMTHTPNAWVDSPKLMYTKLSTMIDNINGVVKDYTIYGVKGMKQGDMPGMGNAPKSSGGGGVIVVSPEDMKN